MDMCNTPICPELIYETCFIACHVNEEYNYKGIKMFEFSDFTHFNYFEKLTSSLCNAPYIL